ncbi:MAG: multicopper oxidase family protein [Nitrospiraceae bacterium]|nr:MAG: multicopper oxidase family protein [Nitrospiraceae bacterium]
MHITPEAPASSFRPFGSQVFHGRGRISKDFGRRTVFLNCCKWVFLPIAPGFILTYLLFNGKSLRGGQRGPAFFNKRRYYMKKLSRRDFFKHASLSALGGYMALKSTEPAAGMMGGGGGGMGGGGTIDSPPGTAFRDPVPMQSVRNGNLVDVTLEPMISQVNVNGTMADLMTYNGYYPGPTISVKKGDVLRINFTNSLPFTTETNLLGYQKNMTNLHTHGWHVSPKEPADAAHLDIMPDETYNYEYDLSMLDSGALNFYHPHRHGLVAEQSWAGLAGAMIVEDEIPVLGGYETHIMVLKDISLNGSAPAPHSVMGDFMNGKEGNIIMVNGQVNPVLPARPGQVQRWRIVNASNARFYKLSLSNHTMYLIGTDGGLLDKAYPRTQILLSPGERVDILVKASATKGNYKFLSLSYSRMGMMMKSPQITLMTLSVQGSKASDGIPSSINPGAVRIDPNSVMIAAERALTLSMGQGRGYINGQDFDVDPYTVMSDLGTYEIWTVVNRSGMDHPFHQHVNAAQVLSISGIDSSYPQYSSIPAWKDTVLVPKWGSVKMLVPVTDVFLSGILDYPKR